MALRHADTDSRPRTRAQPRPTPHAPLMPELASDTPKLHAFLLTLSDKLRFLADPVEIQSE
ncbi:MAG TPA: hypothetical protein VEX14_10850, partial [Burkholderiaceae bacterium]|nr:hypothetical protein [Burkholderiaceae bacterium]